MPTIKLTERALSRIATSQVQEDFLDREFTAGGSFGVRVGRSGRKSFFLLVSARGTRRRISLGSYPVISLEEARTRALGLLRELAEGRDPRGVSVERDLGESFRRFSEQFLEEEIRPRCRPTTVREYERIIRTELIPRWGDSAVTKIRTRDVQSLLEEIAERRSSPVMANRVRALASKLFGTALRRGLISENPVRQVEPVVAESAPDRILESEEILRLWQALRMEKPIIAALFKLLLLLGQLPGELLQMRWSELQGTVWRKPQRGSAVAVRNRGPAARNTHRSGRSPGAGLQNALGAVPIPRLAQQILDELRGTTRARPPVTLASAAAPAGDYVFSSDGNVPLVYIRRASARISSRMGGARFSPSDLRRTTAYHMAKLGIRPDVINEILGRTAHRAAPAYGSSSYDSFRDMEHALEQWSGFVERLCRPQGPQGPRPARKPKAKKNRKKESPPHTAKIIPLFSDDF